jgi:hypothetical protein
MRRVGEGQEDLQRAFISARVPGRTLKDGAAMLGLAKSIAARLFSRKAKTDYPPLPPPRRGYMLVTTDMVAFDILDGDEDCGGIQFREEGEKDRTPWMVHVYGIDLNFPSFGKARAWLGKPPIKMENLPKI